MVTVENEVRLTLQPQLPNSWPISSLGLSDQYNMTKELKTDNRIFKFMKANKKLMEKKYNITVVGWCADEGPDTKKGKHLMENEFLWMIILVCWVHQINLIVGDLLGVKHELIKVIKIVLKIITWFNTHSVPLSWLQDEQELTYSVLWVIFLPVVTHWLTHYHICTRLLKIERAICACWLHKGEDMILKAGKTEKQERARAVLEPIRDPEFWKKLHRQVESNSWYLLPQTHLHYSYQEWRRSLNL